jgi:DNA-binding LytR/AlgR family response regulator
MKAIIAEDEPNQREELVRLLHEHWPELKVAAVCEDGLAALEALNEFSPQVAFLDIRMPGASGIEVARAASGKVHVVFVTAYDEYAVAAFEAGAADYLLKPVTPQRLVQAIERLRARVTTTAPTDRAPPVMRLRIEAAMVTCQRQTCRCGDSGRARPLGWTPKRPAWSSFGTLEASPGRGEVDILRMVLRNLSEFSRSKRVIRV